MYLLLHCNSGCAYWQWKTITRGIRIENARIENDELVLVIEFCISAIYV